MQTDVNRSGPLVLFLAKAVLVRILEEQTHFRLTYSLPSSEIGVTKSRARLNITSFETVPSSCRVCFSTF